jgi:DNA-binding NarL/FixJ family response regulator
MKRAFTISVILADDHELFRDGFALLIEKQTDIELIAVAEDGEALYQRVAELEPEVVVTDIKMPKLNGITAIQRIRKSYPHVGIVVLTNLDEESFIVEALEAGAKGYLLKTADKEEIIAAIKSAYRNKMYYCRTISSKICQLIGGNVSALCRRQKKIEFNAQEKIIIKLICQGLTNREIATHMHLSKRTIESHRERIMSKTGGNSTAALVVYAIKHRLYDI